MSSNRGFILIETMLALFFVLLLALGALQLVVSAANISERSQSMTTGGQIAMQELGGISVHDERYSIQRQSTQQVLGQGINIRKTIISIYDRKLDRVLMNFVVYE